MYELHPIFCPSTTSTTMVRQDDKTDPYAHIFRLQVDPKLPLPVRIRAGDFKTWLEVGDLDFLAHPLEVMSGAHRLASLSTLCPHHPYHRTALQHLWDYVKECPRRYLVCGGWDCAIHWRTDDDPDSPSPYWGMATPSEQRVGADYLKQVTLMYRAATAAMGRLDYREPKAVEGMGRLGEWLAGTGALEDRLHSQAQLLEEWEGDFRMVCNFYHAILANDFDRFLGDFVYAMEVEGLTLDAAAAVLGQCFYELDPIHPYLREQEASDSSTHTNATQELGRAT